MQITLHVGGANEKQQNDSRSSPSRRFWSDSKSTWRAGDAFYQGKSIKIIVGFTSGGFYDRWSRLLARYVPKYIPGNPEMIVQNMPGAGGMIAANHIYSVAKPDGLTVAMLSYGLYLDQLVGRKEVQYDVRKFNWIGSPEKSDVLMYMRSDAPYKTIEDIRKASTPPKCGSTGTAGTDYILARLLEDTLGAKIDTVLGYPGGSEIDLAVEKGEVQCRGHYRRAVFRPRAVHFLAQEKFRQRAAIRRRQARSAHSGHADDLRNLRQGENPGRNRRVADVILRGGDFGRPWVMPPGTPAERRQDHARRLRESDGGYGAVRRSQERQRSKSNLFPGKSCKSSRRQ